MTAPTPSPEEPFDLVKLRELVALMEQHGLTEVDLRSGNERWKLRRGPKEVTQVVGGGGFSGSGYSMMPFPAPSAAP
ncbi:MAG: hypothetical protein NT069_16985, partial [Planctomycetota bacterium]|nr:hypothetical protein [Planctomycetota bacterium]